MKKLIFFLALAVSIITAIPVVLPEQATQAAADDDVAYGTVVYRKMFPYIIQWTYYPGGWVITDAWYDMSIGF